MVEQISCDLKTSAFIGQQKKKEGRDDYNDGSLLKKNQQVHHKKKKGDNHAVKMKSSLISFSQPDYIFSPLCFKCQLVEMLLKSKDKKLNAFRIYKEFMSLIWTKPTV